MLFRPSCGHQAALLLAFVVGASACVSSTTVPRMVDGEVVEGRFVGEGEYARALATRLAEETRRQRGTSPRGSPPRDRRAELDSCFESRDVARALHLAVLMQMPMEELAARWFLAIGEKTPAPFLEVAAARGERSVATYDGDGLPAALPTTRAGRLALEVYFAQRTGERNVFASDRDCADDPVDAVLRRACVRVALHATSGSPPRSASSKGRVISSQESEPRMK